MTNVAFDTLSASKELQDAGIEARQAEAIALVFKSSQSDLATKADSDHLRTELKADIKELKGDIENLRTEVKGDIKQVKGDIENLRTELKGDVRWLRWAMAAVIAVMLGGFGLIISSLP